ncbi:hypothetical protein SDC9_97449 [bioreactor metagenome]|uniref:Ammonium transporter AmtB-like domain-containing protein n=1 Tax=bioreactor metagenome TaxID=1076179 RepID=A0A645ACN2_9ZZZZ
MVSPVGAFFIGLIAGFIVVFGIEFVDKILKIDDPVGAVGVHGLCGASGTLMVGLFSINEYSYGDGLTMSKGLFYGGGFKLLGVEALGVISVMAWVAIVMTIVFLLIKKTIGLRASAEEEILGLDITEHGLESSYADFMPTVERADLITDPTVPIVPMKKNATPIDQAVPVQIVSSGTTASDVKMTRIDILIKQSKFEALKETLNQIGVTGLTVTQVLGCGMQKGRVEYYRGVEMEMNLLPKVQVTIVVAKVPVREVIEAAKKVLYTGNIGDGKIFVYDVENVIKVRTGEEGYDALQDEE